MSFKAEAIQNGVKFTVIEGTTDGTLSSLIENLYLVKKKTEEYYNKMLDEGF